MENWIPFKSRGRDPALILSYYESLFSSLHQARTTGAVSKVTGIVVRTGFSTAKGDLVRSIMFPSPVGFRFYEDAIRFIGVLAILAAFGDIYSFYIFYINGENWWKAIMRILDLITVVVPPSLPCAMTVGTVYSQSRLKEKNIFCISPARINVAGKIKVILCFDFLCIFTGKCL